MSRAAWHGDSRSGPCLPAQAWSGYSADGASASGKRSLCPDQSEADVAGTSIGSVVAAERRPNSPSESVPAATPAHPVRPRDWTGRIRHWTSRILPVPVCSPFPNVSQHVVQPPPVRPLQGNRMRPIPASPSKVPRHLLQLPVSRLRRTRSRGVLPLGLCRQSIQIPLPWLSSVQSPDVLLNVVPRHVLDRAPRAALLELRWILLKHQRLPISLGDLELAHPKSLADPYHMLALVLETVLLTFRRTHEKAPRRDPCELHPQRVCPRITRLSQRVARFFQLPLLFQQRLRPCHPQARLRQFSVPCDERQCPNCESWIPSASQGFPIADPRQHETILRLLWAHFDAADGVLFTRGFGRLLVGCRSGFSRIRGLTSAVRFRERLWNCGRRLLQTHFEGAIVVPPRLGLGRPVLVAW